MTKWIITSFPYNFGENGNKPSILEKKRNDRKFPENYLLHKMPIYINYLKISENKIRKRWYISSLKYSNDQLRQELWMEEVAYTIVCCSVTKLYPVLYNPKDYSPPGPSVHGISKARILELVAISFSKGLFVTQGLNPSFVHWQVDSSPLNHLGSSVYMVGDQIHTEQCV